MELAESLKFVRGAVAKKDFVPALTHFRIKDGRITGYNGRIALSAPIDLDLDVIPKAVPFTKAIAACKETVKIHVTPTGRLSIKSGAFKALVDCLPLEEADAYPTFDPSGDGTPVPEGIVHGLKTLEPFIGDDASRPWSNGVLFRGPSMFATNNVVLAEYWLGEALPFVVNLPGKTVQELLRLRREPQSVVFDDKSITFLFEDGCWLRSQLKEADWPDLSKVLDREHAAEAVPVDLLEALETVKPFTDELERIHFHDGFISTSAIDGEGSTYDVGGLHGKGIYNLRMLETVVAVATHVDFKSYPAPSLWFSDRIRGAIIGMRDDAR